MGFLDSLKSSVSNVVQRVEDKVVEVENKVVDTARADVQKAEDLGHSVVSHFDPTPTAPSAPPGPAPAPSAPSLLPGGLKGSQLQASLTGDLSNWIHKLLGDRPPQIPISTAAPPAAPAAVTPDPNAPSTDPTQSASGAPYAFGMTAGGPVGTRVPDSTPLGTDNAKILENFSQGNGFPSRNMERCGPTSAIASALVKGGPQEVAKLARSIASGMSDPANKKPYLDLAKKLESGKATYGDLGTLGELIHEKFSVPNASGGMAMPYGSANDLFKRTGNVPPQTTSGLSTEDVSKPENFDKAFPPGKPGSWPAKVAINGADDGNHWVTIGRDNSGRAFVYDPMPKQGQPQIVYQDKDPQSFARYQQAINAGKGSTGFAATL